MTEPLFFEPFESDAFDKAAAEVELPDDPNAWPHEILGEIYKALPFLSDFELEVVMDRVDAERGFGLGHIEVSSRTEAPRTSRKKVEATGVRSARVPLIIREKRLQPLDVLVTGDGKMLPLTEQRLRQAVFRPESFDVTAKTPGDQSMIAQLYPPYRQNYGFGGGVTLSGPGDGKTASVLGAVLSLSNESDLDAFKSELLSEEVRLAFLENRAAYGALDKIAQAKPASVKEARSALEFITRPSVLQLTKVASGYRLRAASHRAWAPVTEIIDRGEAVGRLGEKVVLAADLSGSATVTDEQGVPAGDATSPVAAGLVTEPGTYVVSTESGEELEGLVIPNLLDVDAKPKPIALFTDGAHTAVQADIAGRPKGAPGNIAGVPAGEARGHGVFYALAQGLATATVPLELETFRGAEGTVLVGETFDGRPVEVRLLPHLDQIAMGAEPGSLLVPESFQWLPLGETEDVALASAPEAVAKTSSLAQAVSSVEVRGGGPDCFSLSGLAVEDLRAEHRQFLSQDDALFVLGGLGTDLRSAQDKLALAASASAPVRVRVGRFLKTAERTAHEAERRAEAMLSRMPSFRQRLFKEAAVIPDPVAVDTVLALGFLNPENIAALLGYLPVIEEAERRMCELLVASRLGLRQVPASALEKAIRATEEVLSGLKEMAFQT